LRRRKSQAGDSSVQSMEARAMDGKKMKQQKKKRKKDKKKKRRK
jgi:hypothetical protein